MNSISESAPSHGHGRWIGHSMMLVFSMLIVMSAAEVMGSGPSGDDSLPRNGRIAWAQFISFTGFGIFSVEPNGSDLRQLTTPEWGVFDDAHANWSPDGSKIVFERDFGGDQGVSELFRINANGSGLTQLTDCSGDCLGDAFPSYSPDGKKIAFIRYIGPVRDDGNATSGGVWIMKADGSNPRQITQTQLPTVTENVAPSWSPDGRKLVFTQLNTVAEPVGHQAVVVANADGSDIRRITPWLLDATDADWSPYGNLIICTSHHDVVPPGAEQLYTVRPDGSGLVRVIPKGLLAQPANIGGKFSPDGRKIVFRHRNFEDPDSTSLAYTMNLDGSNVRLVLLLDNAIDAPNWGTHP